MKIRAGEAAVQRPEEQERVRHQRVRRTSPRPDWRGAGGEGRRPPVVKA